MTTTTGLYGQTSLPWDGANPARRRYLIAVPTPTWTDDDAPDDTEPERATMRSVLTVAR